MNKLFLEIDNRNCPTYPRLKDQELLKKYPNWRYFRYYIMDRSLNKCIFQSINKSEIILRLDLLGYFLDMKNSQTLDFRRKVKDSFLPYQLGLYGLTSYLKIHLIEKE